MSTDSAESFSKFVLDKGDYVADIGYPSIYTSKIEDKAHIVRSLLKYFLLYRVK